jgi:hypothetical protein
MTDTVLRVHELDAVADRAGLEALAGTRESCVRGLSWVIAVLPDRLEIALDGDPAPALRDDMPRPALAATVILTVPPAEQVEVGDEL